MVQHRKESAAVKAIIVAAGMGTRARPFTQDLPKCLLEVDGQTLLQRAIRSFKEVGIEDISVIRGYKKEKIRPADVTCFDNAAFATTNILHSFICSRSKIVEAIGEDETVIACYSDIVFDVEILELLLEAHGDIAIVVDENWEERYEGRTDHPIHEAELAVCSSQGRLLRIGKDLDPVALGRVHGQGVGLGEFIGMWRLSARGCGVFLEHFDRLDASVGQSDPFQGAERWSKAYITDHLQELIDSGVEVNCARVSGGWLEIDTVQDYQRACDTRPRSSVSKL